MEVTQKSLKQCEMRKDEEATTLCVDCYTYFCNACFKFVHDRKKNSSHKKEKIDLFVPIDTICPEHNRSPMNLFCVDEKGKINIALILLYYRILLCILLLSKYS